VRLPSLNEETVVAPDFATLRRSDEFKPGSSFR
jgi:hypothetical protein